MNRARISLALVWLLAVHHVAAQGGLTCFFTTDFATYSAEEQVIDIVFTIEAPSSVGQAPLSLTTVLDRSGSMQGNKIELLKKTTQFLVGKLSEAGGQQSLGIVTYSDGVQELSGVLPVSSSNSPLLNNLIATVQAGGQTNLAGGLVRGVEQQKAAPGGKIKSVYLFTDGLPTVGPASTQEILSQVNAARSGGDQITISTFGFGSDLDVGLLKGISDAAGGETYIITNEEDIPKAFGDALGGLLSTAAQDITVTLKGEGGASIESIQTGGTVSEADGGVR
ncbi:hypothetical protein BSKO_13979 [Bryopsis sp. KO-2023]|nr:hypothetical protein BSKO_13979 [Bryopsis sp. KO-2023]